MVYQCIQIKAVERMIDTYWTFALMLVIAMAAHYFDNSTSMNYAAIVCRFDGLRVRFGLAK